MSSSLLHLTATRIAEFFRFGCERQLRYSLTPLEARGAEVPGPNTDPKRGPRVGPRPGSELLIEAGRRWERRKLGQVLDRLGPERMRAAGWTEMGDPLRLPCEEVVGVLREPGDVEVLMQPELRLPDPSRFARRFGIDPDLMELAPAAPDLIRIRRDRTHRVWFQVVDIKASRDARISHFAQVAFYTLLLEDLCLSENIAPGMVDTRWARVWSRDGRGPVRFPLGAYRRHVVRILREDLPRIARSTPASCAWHLSSRCIGCIYLDHCRNEADRTDDLARIAGITPLAKQVLHAKGLRTVKDLATSFRRDIYTGCHALEANAAQLEQRAQAMRYGKIFDIERSTHLMGPGEDVRVILTAEGDPVTGLCFALGVRAGSRGGATDGTANLEGEVFIAGEGTPAAEREMLQRFLLRVERILRGADAVTTAGADRQRSAGVRRLSVHFFVYDRSELELLRDLLHRHLSDAELQGAISGVMNVLAPGRGGSGAAERSPPGTVLIDAVSTLFALPVPYVYDLASVSVCLTPTSEPSTHHPPAEYSRPMSSQLAFEKVHEVWRCKDAPHNGGGSPGGVRQEIHRTVLSKLAAIDSVVRAVRERAARGERLQLRAEPLLDDGNEAPITHPTLETLRIFTEMEAAAEALAIRSLHTLPSAERALRFECIRGMELVDRRDDGALVFEFDPDCRDVKFRSSDFNLVLTNDDGRTLPETDRFAWKRWPLMVELVEFDLSTDPPRVILTPGSGFAKAEADGRIHLDRRCVLDRAPSDFNTRRVVSTLRHLARGGEAQFVTDLLSGQVPEGWTPRFEAAGPAFREVIPAGALNADQERAWRAAFEQPVTTIWGPPGTGKTYLLAWILIGLAAAARREGKPCRILTTATTHRAIVNVLARVSAEAGRAGFGDSLRLVKLRGSGNEADAELERSLAEVVPDTQLVSLLDEATGQAEPLVVGSTVWSLWKQMRAAGPDDENDPGANASGQPWCFAPASSPFGFDVVVVDEASQMKVPEALIALSGMRAGGQVILCGDDRQLAPVLRGRYDSENGGGDSLFRSVFEHFTAHFPRLPLRESRRMNGALVRYPRKLFYPGLISMCPEQRIALVGDDTATDTIDDLLREAVLQPDDAVVFCTYTGVRATARNPFEAKTVARITRLARAELADPTTGARFDNDRFISHGLAIISPHRAHNSAILAELLAAGFHADELPVVDTVERMQGNEREMIIVSYAVADREYAEREAEFLLNPNRFNVSITRPRSKLIVLMSEEILRTVPRDEATLTGSAAIQGYPTHCRDGVRDVELPDGEGGWVGVRCRYRRISTEPPMPDR